MRVLVLFVCAAVAGCSERNAQQAAAAEAPAVQFQRAAAATDLAHGERLARVLGCIGCHGSDLTGEDWSEPGFGRLWTANLTRVAPRYSDAELEAMIRTGAGADGSELWEMPSHLFSHLTRDDMAALLAFLRSKPPAGEDHPPPVFEEGARQEIAAGTFKSSAAQVKEEGNRWPPDAGASHALGRYIVRATCAECHGMTLEGGQPHPEATPRPDLRVMVPAYDEAAFNHLLRDGKAAGERELDMMSGVARGRYKHLTDAEMRAVYAYLRAVSGP